MTASVAPFESDREVNEITPLDGEPGIPSVTQARPSRWSRKGIAAVLMFALALVGFAAWAIDHALTRTKPAADTHPLAADRPTSAAAPPRQLDMTPAPMPQATAVGRASTTASSTSPASAGPLIPGLSPLAEDRLDGRVEPIGVRRTGGAAPPRQAAEDAPVLLVSSLVSSRAFRRGAMANEGSGGGSGTAENEAPDLSGHDAIDNTARNLDAYQRQLQTVLDTLNQQADIARQAPGAAAASLPSLPPAAAGPAGLFGGQLQGTQTRRVSAGRLGNRSLTLPKGTTFTCALKTRIISAASGFVSCLVQRNVYSDNGRVLLIERGSNLDGEYRITALRPGTVRIPVLWTRLRTPLGVTVDIESPGTGPLGESGVDGYVDNRWPERIGAALLLSLIDDSVKLVIQNQTNDRTGNTVVLPATTDNASKLAEKVLDSTINIPPLIYQNQGGIVGIYVAHDVDFSSVYELQAQPR